MILNVSTFPLRLVFFITLETIRKGEKMRKEACYPFLYEESKKVEFEILTDKLSSQLGFAASFAEGNFKNELLYVCELVYHLNGSIRGKIAISESHVSFLVAKYSFYEEETKDGLRFVVPAGSTLASSLHIARSIGKEVVRKMYLISKEEKTVDKVLFDFANMVSNYCFMAAIYANKINDVSEKEFVSSSY